jgi:hypothetical protein
MKRLTSLLGLCLAVAVTIGAASEVGYACATSIYGADENGDHVHCSLTGSSKTYCYYSCTCHNDRGGGDCENIYADLGLEAY